MASRREAERWIAAGRVEVNGRVAQLGESADVARDEIRVDGEPIALEAKRYWLLNKPRGVLSTCRDPEGRRTVLELLPKSARSARLFPVGRLDLDSEGLLLLTNDGEVAQALLHPSLGTQRTYEVWVRGSFGEAEAERFASGVRLEEGTTAPAYVEKTGRGLRADERWVRLRLGEGRKRQIRRSMEALGCRVLRLQRVSMGPLSLDGLPVGQSRPLTRGEIDKLRSYARERFRENQRKSDVT